MTEEIEPSASNQPKSTKDTPANKAPAKQATQNKTSSDNTPDSGTVKPDTARASSVEAPRAENRRGSPVALLISFLALIIVSLAGYFGYQQQRILSEQIDALGQTASDYQSMISRLQQQASEQHDDLRQQLQRQEAQFSNDVQGLTDQIVAMNEVISSLNGQDDSGWLADQAYYLLKIANNRMTFMQDAETAIYLLNQADELLSQIDDPKLFASRKKISEDRQSLNARPRLDTTGLAIRISAFQSTIAELPMIQIVAQETKPEVATDTVPDSWYESLLNSLSQLGNQMFTVRSHGQGYSPVISESDEQQLRFAIMMTLQTIQYAVLHHNDALYQANLLQLKSRLDNYFDNQDPAVQTLLLEIDELLKLQVGHEAFAGLSSLPALSTYLQQRNGPATEISREPLQPDQLDEEPGEETIQP